MNTRNMNALRMILTLTTLVLTISFVQPTFAGRIKADRKQHEMSQSNRGDSGNFTVPAPIADDSPINPAQKGDREKPRRDQDHQKKKSRR